MSTTWAEPRQLTLLEDPLDAQFRLSPESCCSVPSQPCYPQCTMPVSTNYYSLAPIVYAGNEGFEYVYYAIDGCWIGPVGEASPAVRVVSCQMLPQETPTPPGGDGGDDGAEPPADTGSKTLAEVVWEWLVSFISYGRGLFHV